MKQKLLTQAGQDHSSAPPLAAGDRGTLFLVLSASPIGRVSWGPTVGNQRWQYCDTKPLGDTCESILVSLELDLNSGLSNENDVMKENIIITLLLG